MSPEEWDQYMEWELTFGIFVPMHSNTPLQGSKEALLLEIKHLREQLYESRETNIRLRTKVIEWERRFEKIREAREGLSFAPTEGGELSMEEGEND